MGLLAGVIGSSQGKTIRIEEILVGIFGAFIGGDFLLAMLAGPAATESGVAAAFGAIGGAVVLLALLALMRRKVGPLRPGKSRAVRR